LADTVSRVEVVLCGGPLDGERRNVPGEAVLNELVFYGPPNAPELAQPGVWYGLDLPRYVYRCRLTPRERGMRAGLLGVGARGLRFDFVYPGAKVPAR
jgi:hypothetical protein